MLEKIHACVCSICQCRDTNPTKEVHRAMNHVLSQLSERQRVLYVGLEAKKRGAGSEHGLSLIFGWDEQAIAVARRELEKETGEAECRDASKQQPPPARSEQEQLAYSGKLAGGKGYEHMRRNMPPIRREYK